MLYPRRYNSSTLLLTAVIDLDFKNAYKALVLTLLGLRRGGVARGWQLHVPALLLLHIHVIIRVFNESSRSRRNLGRQVTSSIPLLADSVTRGLGFINRASNMQDETKSAFPVLCQIIGT
jgi:hypothetical protein